MIGDLDSCGQFFSHSRGSSFISALKCLYVASCHAIIRLLSMYSNKAMLFEGMKNGIQMVT